MTVLAFRGCCLAPWQCLHADLTQISNRKFPELDPPARVVLMRVDHGQARCKALRVLKYFNFVIPSSSLSCA